MALDRQTIERKDFPIGRRGYEPEAVDEHLARIAEELDSLQRQAQRRSGASLAQAASEQVRAIVEAAEQSAAAIERDAEEQATRIRTEAEAEAQRTDQEAIERSRGHVAKVSEQTAQMLQRVDAMESEVTALMEALRTGANRLNADLSLLEQNMGQLYTAAGGTQELPPAPAPAPPAPRPVEASAPAAPPAQPPAGEPAVAAAPAPERAVALAEPALAADTGDDGDVEGARLIALNMALNGQSRAETDRYLAENFALADRDGLLDEVYASVGT
jgi:DivIVA domain-containing protein